MKGHLHYILNIILLCWFSASSAAGPPVKFDKNVFQEQVISMISEDLSKAIHDKFYEAVDQSEVDLLKMSNFYYLLEDFKDLGIDPANPQISQSLNAVYEKVKARYESGDSLTMGEIGGYLSQHWKLAVTKVMDKESADIIESVYNLANDGWKKIKAMEEIQQAPESLSESEITDIFRKWGVSGKFLDKMGDLEIVLRDGYSYISEPLTAANKIIEAIGEKNPGRKIELLFALGNEYSGKIPIIGDLVKQIFVLGEAVLKAANELGGLLSKNLNQGCISESGQYNLQNDKRAASFLAQFPGVERVCPFYVDLDGSATHIPSIYKNTYYDVSEGSHLYFYINEKWFKGKTSPSHQGERDLKAIIGWLRNNGMADKVNDEFLVFQMYNHSPGFLDFRKRVDDIVGDLTDRLYGPGGILTTLSGCDDPSVKEYMVRETGITNLKVLFPKKYPMDWEDFKSEYSYVWDEIAGYTVHCQYNRFIKNSEFPLFSSARPFVELEEVRNRLNFYPVKIWGIVKSSGGSPVPGASIYFDKSSAIFDSDDCKELITNERGNFRFIYMKQNKSLESPRVEASDPQGKSTSERAEIDLSKGSSVYVTIVMDGSSSDCPDGQRWNSAARACERICPPHSITITNAAGLAVNCLCEDGYTWNSDRTECIEKERQPVADTTNWDLDCNVFANMVKAFDAAKNKFYCKCAEGYDPDPSGNGCVKRQTVEDVDCSVYANTEAVIDPATGGVVCDCKTGFVWNEAGTGCISQRDDLINRADCSAWPNTRPVWSDAENGVICDCVAGFEWNSDFTKCVPDKQTQVSQADCSAWPNTRAVWSTAENGVICDCISGFEWNDDFTKCVPDRASQVRAADCSAYPNTGPRWDDTENGVVCDCIYGYEWNSDYTGCEKKRADAPDCASFYPNTRPVYNKKEGKYYCECIKGYEWKKDQSGCVMTEFTAQQNAGSACQEYGPAYGKWNAARNAYDCYCKNGYMWNPAGNYCIKDPNYQSGLDALIDAGTAILDQLGGGSGWGTGAGTPDNPSVDPANQHQGVCNTIYKSGADAPEQYSIPINTGGVYKFYYDHISIKDRTHVYYNGQKVFDSGCVGGSQTVDLNLSGFGGNVTIIVDPNCEGTSSTQWSIKLTCP